MQKLGTFSRRCDIIKDPAITGDESGAYYAFANGIRLKDPSTNEFSQRLLIEIDGEKDPQAVEKLMAHFDALPIGTEILVKRGGGYENFTKTEENWTKPVVNPRYDPANNHHNYGAGAGTGPETLDM